MPERFETKQIALHWVIVLLVALQFILHEPMSDAFDRIEDGGEAVLGPLVGMHIFFGFCVFALTLVRLSLRLSLGTPPPPAQEPPLLARLAHGAHWAFYALLVAMPVSGAVAWFRGNEAAADAHEVMKFVLLALIALHLAGVLVHQFVWKTAILKRMDPRG